MIFDDFGAGTLLLPIIRYLIGFLMIALHALAIFAIIIAIPGIRRWAREGGKPTPVQVTVPVTLPTGGGEGASSSGASAFVMPAAPAAAGRPAIDVRLEACSEVVGGSSSAGPVQTVQLVIENVGDGPAFGLRLEPVAGESAMCFDGLACRGVLKREIPALGAGRELRFKAGMRDEVIKALGGEVLPVQPKVNARFATAFAAEGDESVVKASIGVCTHGLEACAVSPNHGAGKPAARNPFKPLGKG